MIYLIVVNYKHVDKLWRLINNWNEIYTSHLSWSKKYTVHNLQYESLVPIPLMQLSQLSIVLRRQPSFTRYIHHISDKPSVLLQTYCVPIDINCVEFKNGLCLFRVGVLKRHCGGSCLSVEIITNNIKMHELCKTCPDDA